MMTRVMRPLTFAAAVVLGLVGCRRSAHGESGGPATAASDSSDVASDPLSCGARGHSCQGGSCLGGVCQPFVLATGRAELNGQVDLFDPQQVAKLGRLLGAGGIVTGTILHSDEEYTLNARVILVENAKVASVGKAMLRRKDADQRGECGGGEAGRPVASGAAPGPGPSGGQTAPATEFFFQDFHDVGDGEVPKGWNASERMLVTGAGRSHSLQITSSSGEASAVIDGVNFPDSFTFEIMFSQKDNNGGLGIAAADLNFGTDVMCGFVNGVRLLDEHRCGVIGGEDQRHVLSVEKRGAVIKLLVDGAEKVVLRKNTFKTGKMMQLQMSGNVHIYQMKGTSL